MTEEAILGCAVEMKGGKWFAQIVTNAPLLEGRVMASEIRPTREDAIAAAMASAGVTELVPPEQSLRFGKKAHAPPGQGQAGLIVALARCEVAVLKLIETIRGS